MDSLNPTICALVIGLISTWIGLQGLLAGHQMKRERGPDALMHYPVPLPWLRGKVSSARWVVWLGAIYALGGAALGAVALIATLPTETGSQDRVSCPMLLDAEEFASLTEQAAPEVKVMRQQHGCVVQYTGPAGDVLAEMRAHPPEVLIGAGYEHHLRELKRRGLVIEPVPDLGNDAVLAQGEPETEVAPVLLFRRAGQTIRLELDHTAFSIGQIRRVIDHLNKERTQVQENQG